MQTEGQRGREWAIGEDTSVVAIVECHRLSGVRMALFSDETFFNALGCVCVDLASRGKGLFFDHWHYQVPRLVPPPLGT
jgi:hypothetical protein